ncbi:MAG: hypothetical protein LBP86_06465 [Azoarcus sp.]|jgi:hypothetical protein|nr:hypothetical protein [Azoarcus sp.]
MSRGKDWIPGSEASLITLMAAWQTRLASAASRTAYGWARYRPDGSRGGFDLPG